VMPTFQCTQSRETDSRFLSRAISASSDTAQYPTLRLCSFRHLAMMILSVLSERNRKVLDAGVQR
jgi:hypothetical protein